MDPMVSEKTKMQVKGLKREQWGNEKAVKPVSVVECSKTLRGNGKRRHVNGKTQEIQGKM